LHVSKGVFVGVPVRRGHAVRNHIDLVVEVKGIDDGMLDASLGPGPGEIEPLDVELPEHRVQPCRIESTVVLLADLEVARLRIESIPVLGIGVPVNAVGPVVLEVLANGSLFRKKMALDDTILTPSARPASITSRTVANSRFESS